jgi:hypothetical protein
MPGCLKPIKNSSKYTQDLKKALNLNRVRAFLFLEEFNYLLLPDCPSLVEILCQFSPK